MANRYFLNIGVNYNSTANWSATSGGTGGASVPTNADDVFFDANSGNCTVNVASVAKSVNFTGYTNTITMTSTLTVSGSVTLVAAMTIAGAGTLTVLGTSTLTSNGKTWPNAFTHSQGGTITLADDLTISGLLSITGDTTTINGTFNINANGGFNYFGAINQGTGTTTLNLLGGTWSAGLSVAVLRLNTVINGNITISGNVYYNTGTLTYTSGTVTSTGSTINISAATTITVNNSGLTFNNITATANVTFSGTNGCTINGTFTSTTAGTTHIFVSTLTYTINALNIAGTNASRVTIRSSTGGSKALINLNSIQSEYYLNVTDIDGSGGSAGYTFGGTVTNSDNWNASTILYYVGTANFSATSSWSAYSGGVPIGSISAPASTDDIRFDANSINNCTMNVAGVCKSVNFTGYVGTITMSNTLTVSGNVTLDAGMGVAGTAALIVNTTATLTSNTKTWSAGFTFSGTSQTYTLADAWAISGVLRLSATTACTINSNSITSSGNLTSTTLATTSGTTSITLTGGTWSNSSNGHLRNNLTINGNITISGTVYYNTGTLTYTSGTVTTTGSTLHMEVGPTTDTLNVNGIIWNNCSFVGTGGTTILNSDFTLTGLLTLSNRTLNGNTIYAGGGITTIGGFASTGTTNIILNGTGTWSGSSRISNNLTINTSGTITISGTISYGGNTLTYTSGTVIVTGSTLNIQGASGNTTFNTSGINWNNITINEVNTINLSTDLNINGALTLPTGIVTYTTTINNNTINLKGNLSLTGAGTVTGTALLNLNGTGTWSSASTSPLRLNTTINTSGTITISGNVYYNTGTLTYTSGIVKANTATLNIGASTTFINCDKINFKTITITAGTTQTFNRFFSGSALVPTRIQSTGANYTIAFQDGFEKITKFTKISNCTVANRGQLLCITDKSNKGGNVGVRYINQLANGIPLNSPTTNNPMVFSVSNISDPNFILN